MSENQFSLNVLRFEDIRSNIVDFLKKNSKYSANFDYDGHNISMILDGMSYTDMLLAYHLTNIANNIFLDTTTLRKNAVSLSKMLGYRPKRKIPAQIYGNIIYKGENFKSDSFIIIPPHIKFLGANNGLPYTNYEAIKLTYKDSNTLSGRFIFYQGDFQEYRTFGTGKPFQTITIPNENISEYNLSVFVKNSTDPDYTKELWQEVKTFFEISQEKIYFVEEDIQQEYCPKIIFGTGVIGEIPTTSQQIIVEYFETQGEKGNGENQFVLNDTLDKVISSADIDFNSDNLYFDIPDGRYTFNGKDNETLEEIQVNAIRFFSAAGRGVTQNDYKTIMKEFSNIFAFNSTGNIDPTKNVLAFNVMGAEQIWNDPKNELGKIFITGIPEINYDEIEKNAQFYLDDWQEVAILGDLQHLGIVSTMKTFIKPTYMLVEVYPKIEISNQTPEDEINTIFNAVITNLKSYFKTNLSQLGKPFRFSKVQATIDDTPNVLSSDLSVKFNFIINYDSFYRDKPTIIFLPVIFKKDEAGNIIYDKNYIPLKEPFVKTNVEIIKEENEKKGNDYDVFTLPPNLSSIYGELTHPNIVRSMYSKDLKNYNIFKFYLLNNILVYESNDFYDNQGNLIHPIIIESGTSNVWNVLFDNELVGILKYENNEFSFDCSIEQEDYMKNLGIILPNKILKLSKLVNNETFDYYTLNINISNIIADVRLHGLRVLGCLTYDNIEKQILINNPVKGLYNFTTKSTESNDVSLKEINGQTYLMINNSPVATINHTTQTLSDGTVKDIFTISNFQNLLNDFGFKKELEIDASNCIIAYDIYNETSIGSFNYMTGELSFNQEVTGKLEDLIEITSTINDVFNMYELGDTTGTKNPYDIIHIKPANIYDSDGNIIGQYQDFDTLFSTLITHNIYSPEIKKV